MLCDFIRIFSANFLQIFLPVHCNQHYCLYCFNMYHGQIDILDPLKYGQQYDKDRFHSGVCTRVRERLNSILRRMTNGMSPDMSNWEMTYVDVPSQVLVNDCLFFCMMYIERYHGFLRTMQPEISPVSSHFMAWCTVIVSCLPCTVIFLWFF